MAGITEFTFEENQEVSFKIEITQIFNSQFEYKFVCYYGKLRPNKDNRFISYSYIAFRKSSYIEARNFEIKKDD